MAVGVSGGINVSRRHSRRVSLVVELSRFAEALFGLHTCGSAGRTVVSTARQVSRRCEHLPRSLVGRVYPAAAWVFPCVHVVRGCRQAAQHADRVLVGGAVLVADPPWWALGYGECGRWPSGLRRRGRKKPIDARRRQPAIALHLPTVRRDPMRWDVRLAVAAVHRPVVHLVRPVHRLDRHPGGVRTAVEAFRMVCPSSSPIFLSDPM